MDDVFMTHAERVHAHRAKQPPQRISYAEMTERLSATSFTPAERTPLLLGNEFLVTAEGRFMVDKGTIPASAWLTLPGSPVLADAGAAPSSPAAPVSDETPPEPAPCWMPALSAQLRAALDPKRAATPLVDVFAAELPPTEPSK